MTAYDARGWEKVVESVHEIFDDYGVKGADGSIQSKANAVCAERDRLRAALKWIEENCEKPSAVWDKANEALKP